MNPFTHDVRFTGTITTLTPFNSVPPFSPKVSVGVDGTANDVVHMPAMFDGKLMLVPCISSSTIRGKLRRAATNVALSHIEGKPSLKAWQHSVLGSIKGGGPEADFSITSRLERRTKLPVIGLFGAADPWDFSSAYITPAIPQQPIEAYGIAGARTNDFQAKLDIFDVLDANGPADFSAQRDSAKKSSDEKRNAKSQASKGGKKTSQPIVEDAIDPAPPEKPGVITNALQQMPAHRFIPAGVVMNHTMTLKKSSGIEVGLFLSAIQHMFDHDPVFGGKAAYGYGEIEANWNVRMRKANEPWTDAGTINCKPYEAPQYTDKRLLAMVTEWNNFASQEGFSINL